VDYLCGAYWYSLAAHGPPTFVAGEVDGNVSFFYRFVLTRAGRVASIQRAGRKIRGVVMGASITPDGRYIGYVLMTVLRHGRASTAHTSGIWSPARSLPPGRFRKTTRSAACHLMPAAPP
jgi:hypothetical protein